MLARPVFRVAVVEGDERARGEVRLLLEGMGGLVVEAHDDSELRRVLAEGPALDVVVAELAHAAVAVIAELRSRGDTTPVVLMSTDVGDARRAVRRGDGVLIVEKPVRSAELRHAVLASVRLPVATGGWRPERTAEP